MQLNGNQAPVRSDAISAQIGSGIAGEIDLYEELVAFAEMSAEDQWRYLHPVETAAENTSDTEVGEASVSDSTDSPAEPHAELSQANPFDAAPNPAEETVSAVSELADVFGASGPLSDLGLDADLVGVDSEQAVSPFDTGDVFADLDTDLCDAESGESEALFQGSGPFADLDLGTDVADDKSSRTCPACQAEQGADELFCADCGGFLNGISSNSTSSTSASTCSECTQDISTDEIFCPWCGSVLADAGLLSSSL